MLSDEKITNLLCLLFYVLCPFIELVSLVWRLQVFPFFFCITLGEFMKVVRKVKHGASDTLSACTCILISAFCPETALPWSQSRQSSSRGCHLFFPVAYHWSALHVLPAQLCTAIKRLENWSNYWGPFVLSSLMGGTIELSAYLFKKEISWHNSLRAWGFTS